MTHMLSQNTADKPGLALFVNPRLPAWLLAVEVVQEYRPCSTAEHWKHRKDGQQTSSPNFIRSCAAEHVPHRPTRTACLHRVGGAVFLQVEVHTAAGCLTEGVVPFSQGEDDCRHGSGGPSTASPCHL